MNLDRSIKPDILKGFKIDVKAAVGIVYNKYNQLLLGKAITQDERNGKWVFPGGGVDSGESPLQAAVREVYEETGVSAFPTALPMVIHPSKPFVAFFCLKCDIEDEDYALEANEEFSELQWFDLDKLPTNTLTLNTEILKMIGK